MANNDIFPAPNFDKVKEALIQYFKSNDTFKDLNYTGSAVNSLMDIMSYLYIHCMVYSNFSLGESFLETALFRKDILQKASMLGYVPFQYHPAHARIRLNFLPSNPNIPPLYFPAGIYFRGNNNKGQWNFSTRTNQIIEQRADGTYFADLDIYEGLPVTETWIQDQWYQNRYIFAEEKLDTDTFEVAITDPITDSTYLFKSYNDISTLGPAEHIFYWREIDNNKIEIYFGDNVLSKKLENGWIINASVFSCAGSDANNVTSFVIQDKGEMAPYDFTISTLLSSIEGGNKQTDSSIKFEAPHYFQRQDRNVTAEDYRTFLTSKYGNIFKHINVWGGEDNVPARYGEVFCCFVPYEGVYLTDQLKNEILNALKRYNVVTIRPSIIEAIPIYINVVCTVLFDRNKSNHRAPEIEAAVRDIFTNQYIQNAQGSYKIVYSTTINKIQLVEDSIVDIQFTEQFFQSFLPLNNLEYSYYFNFQNAINRGSIVTDTWITTAFPNIGFNCQIQDDSEGNLMFSIDDKPQGIVGSVDYDSGIVRIDNFSFRGLTTLNMLNIYAVPLAHNNSTKNEYIMMNAKTTINVIDINMSANDLL